MYDVPAGWKERVISKVEKGTNGTDSEWYNPANKKEKIYTTYLGGFRKLGPKVGFVKASFVEAKEASYLYTFGFFFVGGRYPVCRIR